MSEYNFNFGEFKRLCLEVKSVKAAHPQYFESEWDVTLPDIARVVQALDSLKNQVHYLVRELGITDWIRVLRCHGDGRLPKNLWVAVFFRGQFPGDGVYPIMSFDDRGEGFYVGCTESYSNRKIGFEKFIASDDEYGKQIKNRTYKARVARGVRHFDIPDDGSMDEEALRKAFRDALDIFEAYKTARESSQLPKSMDEVGEDGGGHGSKEKDWFKEVEVDDVELWQAFLAKITNEDGRHWIYRGHGDAEWELASTAERGMSRWEDGSPKEGQVRECSRRENTAMARFIRETAMNPERKRENDIDALALMQHFGCKTRLLDFSFSPLVALYMAQDTNSALCSNLLAYVKRAFGKDKLEPPVKYAVWAVCLDVFMSETNKNKWTQFEEESYETAGKILDSRSKNSEDSKDSESSEDSKDSEKHGLVMVLPKVGNERLSAQEGLFVMQRKPGRLFGNELLAMALEQAKGDSGKLEALQKADFTASTISAMMKTTKDFRAPFYCYKFVFSPDVVRDNVYSVLKMTRNGAKYIYPDMTGIAKGISDEVYRRPYRDDTVESDNRKPGASSR